MLRKYCFHVALMACFILPIMLLMFLDYFNIESFSYHLFSQNFVFGWTWKGRMFYLIFLWLLFIESIIDWKSVIEKKPKNPYNTSASLICALVPTLYVLSINFLGLSQTILETGRKLGITLDDFTYFHWPLSCEYTVFTIFFMMATALAYKKEGLGTFSLAFSFLGGVSVAYMFDTIYPFGVFKPLQEFTLPTAASAAALFDLLGYKTTLTFSSTYMDSLPCLTVSMGGKTAGVAIAWACAGVHSLLLYVLIILVFFKKANISDFRKLLYFIIGLFGTFSVNVLRIFSVVVIMLNYGRDAGIVFHNTYGEIYFFTWIFLYILLIACIQKFTLAERARHILQRLGSFCGTVIGRISSYLRIKFKL